MYFIYKKQINVASEYSYNVDSIVEWFKDYIDQDDIIEAHGGVEEVTAKDIVDDIFCESDFWYDGSRKNFLCHQTVENLFPVSGDYFSDNDTGIGNHRSTYQNN